MKNFTIESAMSNFEEMMEQAQQGLTVIIKGSDDRDDVLALKPLVGNGPREAGNLRGKIKIADDFDAPLPEFTPNAV